MTASRGQWFSNDLFLFRKIHFRKNCETLFSDFNAASVLVDLVLSWENLILTLMTGDLINISMYIEKRQRARRLPAILRQSIKIICYHHNTSSLSLLPNVDFHSDIQFFVHWNNDADTHQSGPSLGFSQDAQYDIWTNMMTSAPCADERSELT